MSSTSASSTITALRSLFAIHGLPEEIVADNGPQFVAGDTQQRWKDLGNSDHFFRQTTNRVKHFFFPHNSGSLSSLANWVIILNLYAKTIFLWNLELMTEILCSSLKYKGWGG